MCPVAASSFKPAGNPLAEKVIGRSPVAATVKMNGLPGRTPNTFALLMRGLGEGFGVRIIAGSIAGRFVDWVCAAVGISTSPARTAMAVAKQRCAVEVSGDVFRKL